MGQRRSNLGLFDHWKKKLKNQFRVLDNDEPFNWSKLNNLGCLHKTEILLFLNNDIQAKDDGWLGAMLQQVYRPNMGCVGAPVYPNGLIQHGGI